MAPYCGAGWPAMTVVVVAPVGMSSPTCRLSISILCWVCMHAHTLGKKTQIRLLKRSKNLQTKTGKPQCGLVEKRFTLSGASSVPDKIFSIRDTSSSKLTSFKTLEGLMKKQATHAIYEQKRDHCSEKVVGL